MRSLLAALLLSAAASASTNSSCGCDVSNGTVSFAADSGLDVIFVIDVSQSMDSRSLIQASSLVDSIINSLRFDSEFYGRNSSDSNSTSFLSELPWAEFSWNNNSSDYNSTFTRQMFEVLLETNLAFAWNNTDNSTNTREFSEMLFSNFGWNNTDNSTNTREFSEMLFSNLGWNNTDNSTFTRDFSEMLFANLAFGWNNTDNNSTNTREFFSNLAFGWNNTDNNSTFTREMSEMLLTNLAFGWNNTDNNSTFTRQFSEMLFSNLYGNFSGNSSRLGLVAVSDTAEILSDLSSPLFMKTTELSRAEASRARINYGISAAIDMFAASSTRSSRQLIYVISASHSAPAMNPRFGQTRRRSPEAEFKRAGGVIAVTDLTSAGGGSPSLHHLASPGFYRRGFRNDANVELQLLCDANCS